MWLLTMLAVSAAAAANFTAAAAASVAAAAAVAEAVEALLQSVLVQRDCRTLSVCLFGRRRHLQFFAGVR